MAGTRGHATAANAVEGQNPKDSAAFEARVLATAQGVSARHLDRRLPAQTLDRWFRSVLGRRATVTWGVTDCGEATGSDADGPRDLPVCVEVTGTRPNGVTAAVNLLVGTSKSGAGDAPRVYLAYVRGPAGIAVVERLADLPAVMSLGREFR